MKDTDAQDRADAPRGAAAVFGPLINLVVAPREAFRAFDARPLLALWVLLWVAVGTILLSLVNLDVTRQFMRVGMVQGMQQQGREMDAEQMSRMIEQMDRWAPVWSIAGTLFVVIGVLVFALLIWAGSTMAGGSNRFSRSLAVASGGAVAHPLMYTAFVTLNWWLNPPEVRRVEEIFAATPSLGLDLLFAGGDLSPMVRTLLQRVDVFNLWWIVLVVIGAQVLLRLKRGGAITIATTVWALSTAIAAFWASLQA